MKIVIDIDEDMAQGIIDGKNDEPRNIVRAFQATIADAIKNGIMISENPTNGDIIKAMFPNDRFELSSGFYESKRDHGMRCTYDWWNALWKEGEEE